MRLLTLIIFQLLLAARIASSATYFVDFESGVNGNNGTSTATPWKHSPGDTNATSNSNITPALGDTIKFKGGAVYRGKIVPSSGVTYNGLAGWGTGNAIMDNSQVITSSWTRCISPADCHNNSNWTNVWWTTVPAGVSNCLPVLLSNGTNWGYWSQDPNPSDRTFWQTLLEQRTHHQTNAGQTWVRDTTYFTNAAGFYDNTFIGIWVYGNSFPIFAITNYAASSNALQFPNSENAPYTDRTGYYCIINHPYYIDQAGEWAVRTNENRIYHWPLDSTHPTNSILSLSQHGNAFSALSVTGVVVNGFSIRGYDQLNGNGYTGGIGVNFGGSGSVSHYHTITSNEVYNVRNINGGPVINVEQGTNAFVGWNYLHDFILSRGMILKGESRTVFGNRLKHFNATGIYFAGCVNSVIHSNSVTDMAAIHGNGISVYQLSTNVIVSHNTVSNATLAITSQQSRGLKFYNNFIHRGTVTDSALLQIDYDYYGTIFVNNTVAGVPTNVTPVYVGFVRGTENLSPTNVWDGVTNIFEGNIYWGVHQGRSNVLLYYNGNLDGSSLYKNSWYPNNTVTNEVDVFNNSAVGDYTPKAGSVLINGSQSFSSLFSDDIRNTSRGAGPWDIGAYEYQAGGGSSSAYQGFQFGSGVRTSGRVTVGQ